MKRIAIFLPSLCLTQSGGYKVIFDYANRFADKGWDVQLVLPMFMLAGDGIFKKLIKGVVRSVLLAVCRNARRPKWFDLSEKVRTRIVLTLDQRFVPDADVYVATAANTAYYLMRYRNCAAAYFVQGYETWILDESRLFDTYRSKLVKFSISNWLADEIRSVREQTVTVIPNGLDFNCWGCDIPYSNRYPHSIAVMYHPAEYKRFDISMSAILALKGKWPDLQVTVFGVYHRPETLPEWCSYHFRPTQQELRAIYNDSAVYLAMSRSEGWGLTVGEAMACGCVVCCSNCKGYLEMATDRVNALVCATDDVHGASELVSMAFEDRGSSSRLSEAAVTGMRRFSSEKSFSIFEERLCKVPRQECLA